MDPRPPRLRLSYGMRRKGSNLTNNSSAERASSARNARQRYYSGDSVSSADPDTINVDDDQTNIVPDSIDLALENLDIELTEYEKLIMNKYLQEMQHTTIPNSPQCDEEAQPKDISTPVSISMTILSDEDTSIMTQFPVKEHHDSNCFPTKYRSQSALKNQTEQHNDVPSPTMLPTSSEIHVVCSSSASSSESRVDRSFVGATGEVRNYRATARNFNRNQHQPNNRNGLRKNFSIWVGVTSCVWGLLLYLDKSYF